MLRSRNEPPECDPKDSTVSWQSAFWGLFLPAINTFVQDAGIASNPIVGARQILRLSPFICIVDAVWILYTFAALWNWHHVNPTKLREKVVKIRSDLAKIATEVLRRQGLETQEKDKMPLYVRMLLAFTAFTQMVKLSGMQGIPFTVFCAWCYFVGYLVIEVMRGLAANDIESTPQEASQPSLWSTTKNWANAAVKAVAAGTASQGPSELPLWKSLGGRIDAVKQSLAANGIISHERSSQDRREFTSTEKKRVVAAVIIFGLAFALQIILTFILLLRLTNLVLFDHNPLQNWKGMPSVKNAALMSMCTSLRSSTAFWWLMWGTMGSLLPSPHMWWLDQVLFAVCMARFLALGCEQMGRLLLCLNALEPVRQKMGVATMGQWMMKCFVFVSVVVVFANYAVIYQDDGTYNPAWTEKLG